MGAATACRVEDRVGSLTPGKYADLVVLGSDPVTADSQQIADIPVLATVVGADLIHGSWPA
jgi:predicted amidohydrolase YtcJ